MRCCGRVANGKALASLLKLGAAAGAELCIAANGPDADAALAALRQAVEAGLRDEQPAAAELDAAAWTPPAGTHAVSGIAASPGVAVGPLFQFRASRVVVSDRGAVSPTSARRELAQALETAREQLGDIHDAVAARAGNAEAAIFRAHQALLRDEDLIAEVVALIDVGYGAGRAWERAVAARVADLRSVEDERVAARSADLHDVGQRVLRLLAGTEHGAPELPDTPVILVAEDLAPSDTARLDPRRILGLCTVMGGPTAHTAIIARSLDIPAVVGAGPEVLEHPHGAIAVLDGAAGRLYLEPGAEALASARDFQAERRRRRDRDFATRFEPAILTDGHRIGISANISRVGEAAQAVDAGADGVGLMRTEFLFLERDRAPGEDEQYEAYGAMVRALDGRPLILRTLDIGGDKIVPYLALPKEENPFLGVRGLRLCLRQPELFLPQLRAMYRASRLGPVRIMLPMVSAVEEVRAARELAERARREVGAAPVELGMMIEVPSAALMAPELAAVADFFSIGTNDLTQYVLAMDRTHPTLAPHADGLHPAVLRAIELAVRAAGAGEPLGRRLRRDRGRSGGRADHDRARRRGAQHEPAEHRGGEGGDAAALARRGPGLRPARPRLRHRGGRSTVALAMTAVPDVVTVTPNPAIDWTLTVPNFTMGGINRVAAARSAPAGKGVNAAAALAAAGFHVAATGWLGAANAAPFEAFFAERGIADHFVRVPGETRVDVKIADPAAQRTTSVDFAGLTPPPAERSLLMERVLRLAAPNRWIVMAGSLPPGVDPGFYCELATLVAGAGARVLVDASGDPLRRALRSEPHVLKPNLRELETLVGRALPTRGDVVSAARGLLKGETELVAVSAGADGALFVTADRAVAARPPAVPVESSVGAGDAMAAGIVAARLRGLGPGGDRAAGERFRARALSPGSRRTAGWSGLRCRTPAEQGRGRPQAGE